MIIKKILFMFLFLHLSFVNSYPVTFLNNQTGIDDLNLPVTDNRLNIYSKIHQNHITNIYKTDMRLINGFFKNKNVSLEDIQKRFYLVNPENINYNNLVLLSNITYNENLTNMKCNVCLGVTNQMLRLNHFLFGSRL